MIKKIHMKSYLFAAKKCKDAKLRNLSSSFVMSKRGWSFSTQEDKPSDFSTQCGFSTWYGWSHGDLVGLISATFSGKGYGTIKFGNCGMDGVVLGLLGHEPFGFAHKNQTVTATFNYEPGSTLVIQEIGSAIIKVHELILDCLE